MAQPSVAKPSRVLIVAAFFALYTIWGSTYLGIRLAIESIPPFIMIGSRFLIAGLLLLVYCLVKGEKLPTKKALVSIGFGGVLMLFIGNGAVTFAEQYLPSGLAAIVVATVPLWFVVLDKHQWAYYFANRWIIIGILVGFAGVLLLFAGKGTLDFFSDKMKLLSFFVLLAGSIGWAIGSLYSKYRQANATVTMKAAVQMLAAGIFSLITAFITNEQQGFAVSQVTVQSWLALLYLIVMGSLVAYMSYVWLLNVLPPSIVGTYAYVNPVVAVFLGYLVLDEVITSQQVLALAVILIGVILVNVAKERTRLKEIQTSRILQNTAVE